MSLRERLRKEAEEHQKITASLRPKLNSIGHIKTELERLASSLPVRDDLPHVGETRAAMLELLNAIPTQQGELLMSAIVAQVSAKMYWLMAEVLDYQLQTVLMPRRSEAAQRRSAVNQEIKVAAIKGHADGDWSDLAEITKRLAAGQIGSGSEGGSVGEGSEAEGGPAADP